MKKIFILSMPGAEEKMIVADNADEAFKRRGEVDPAYEYLPVQVKELEIEGHDIHVKLKKEEKQEELPPETPTAEPEIPQDKPPEKPKKPKQLKKPKQE